MTDETTYHVPITAHGGVYVRAADKDEAVEQAVRHVDSGDLETSRDIRLERVRADEPTNGTPANVEDPTDSRRVEVPLPPTIADLQEARERVGLSRADVADALDVHASTVGKWEREVHPLTLKQARSYASVVRREQYDLDRTD